MRLKEQWIIWKPMSKFAGQYERICFMDSSKEGVVITYAQKENPKKIMKVIFGGGFVGYRNTDETYMYEIQSACSTQGGIAYKVLNSNYIQWLSEVSGSLSTALLPGLQHFVFVSWDDYLEILADSDPKIEFTELP